MQATWPHRIVVGVDTSPESQAAIDHALELAKGAGGTVLAVHAVGLLEEGAYRPHPDLAAILRAACERTGCPPAVVVDPVIEHGPATAVLLRVAQRVDADLIVVGRRGIGASDQPIGSTSVGVVASAETPVLVVTSDR
jgi:nucleotide-binding universal stress UspA family protein